MKHLILTTLLLSGISTFSQASSSPQPGMPTMSGNMSSSAAGSSAPPAASEPKMDSTMTSGMASGSSMATPTPPVIASAPAATSTMPAAPSPTPATVSHPAPAAGHGMQAHHKMSKEEQEAKLLTDAEELYQKAEASVQAMPEGLEKSKADLHLKHAKVDLDAAKDPVLKTHMKNNIKYVKKHLKNIKMNHK